MEWGIMMYKKILAILFVLCLALPVSAKRQSEEIITTMTQLQKRNFQTRTYSSNDKVLIMKALLNVFQDEGYMVYNVNSLLGFIYSVKDFDTTDPNVDISKEFGLTKSRLNYNGVKVATVESTANVTEYGDSVRVRVNFKRKLLNEYGNAQLVEDIEESSFYDEFYSKVDKALNLQNLTVPAQPVKEVPVSVQKPEPVKEEVVEFSQTEQNILQEENVEEVITPSEEAAVEPEPEIIMQEPEEKSFSEGNSDEYVNEREDSPYFRPEDVLYETDVKEQARRDKLIQKEHKKINITFIVNVNKGRKVSLDIDSKLSEILSEFNIKENQEIIPIHSYKILNKEKTYRENHVKNEDEILIYLLKIKLEEDLKEIIDFFLAEYKEINFDKYQNILKNAIMDKANIPKFNKKYDGR